MYNIDHTHDPGLQSWVESANEPTSDFPVQNLPFCVFQTQPNPPTVGVGIGDLILDLRKCCEQGLLEERWAEIVSGETLNPIMALDPDSRRDLRHAISSLLFVGTMADRQALEKTVVYQSDVNFCLPCQIGDYSDFYASVFHATNVGSMFRPDNPLLPNYKHIPIGYHGRSSSIVISGTSVRRPVGQLAPASDDAGPTRDACKLLDYELEVGCFVARGNRLGETIPISQVEDCLFGLCLLNDWSARDLQKWEYQPLGPFLAKSFATSISPWVVTMEALAPFRCPAQTRPESDPQPLPYLNDHQIQTTGGVDLKLDVYLRSQKMADAGMEPLKLSQGNLVDMYWTFGQMVTHHSSNGCNLQPGDLLGSGTVSGLARESRGCLLELTWDGDQQNPVPGSQRTPIKLPTGEQRKFLADGDEVIFKGFCEAENHRRIGFGECVGRILEANAQ